jgi:hypothetical protein
MQRIADSRNPYAAGADRTQLDEEIMARLSDDQLLLRAACANDLEMLRTLTGGIQNGEPMSTLTDDIKEFIVRRLACCDTPSEVVDAVNVNFGVTVSRQQVHRYDPNCSDPPAQRWRDLYAATRQVWLREVAEIGIAQKAVRLAMLDRMARRAMSSHRMDRTLSCLEQAAKECGGIYENRRPVVLQVAMPQGSALSADGAHPLIESAPLPQLPDLLGGADA